MLPVSLTHTAFCCRLAWFELRNGSAAPRLTSRPIAWHPVCSQGAYNGCRCTTLESKLSSLVYYHRRTCAGGARQLSDHLGRSHHCSFTSSHPGADLSRHSGCGASGLVRSCVMASSAARRSKAELAGEVFFLDEFAIRQWDDPTYSGTRIPQSVDKADFVRQVHEAHASGAAPLVDGYAPFCKHLFLRNTTGARLGALAITDANRRLLHSGYTKRRPEELAVLSRWFPAEEVEVQEAKFLDVILYSREQLVKEYQDMPTKAKDHPNDLPQAPWGMISIKAQDEDYETPMAPITMLRNALGRDQGGSGVRLDRRQYEAAVAFWEAHATVVSSAAQREQAMGVR